MHTSAIISKDMADAVNLAKDIPWLRCGYNPPKYIDAFSDIKKRLDEIMPQAVIVIIGQDRRLDALTKCEIRNRSWKTAAVFSEKDFNLSRDAFRHGADDFFSYPAEKNDLVKYIVKLATDADVNAAYPDYLDKRFIDMLDFAASRAKDKVSLSDLSEYSGYNKNHICKLFREKMGMTFVEFISRERMRLACGMLTSTFASVEEISKQCGYTDSAYFNRVFKRVYGLTPASYRKARL